MIQTVNVILNVLSVVGGSLVVMLIFGLGVFESKVMNRVSIRFTLGISVVDILKALMILCYTLVEEDGVLCSFMSFSIQWLTLVYMFLNSSIALNLLLVFVKGRAFRSKWEVRYWIGSLTLSTCLLLPSLLFGRLGLDPLRVTCEYRQPKTTATYLWMWGSFLFWVLAMCLFCLVVALMTIHQVNLNQSRFSAILSHSSKEEPLRRDMQRLARRVALYCIIPIATQLGFVSYHIHYYYAPEPNMLIVWFSVVSSDLPGILNLLAFLIDPAFSNAVRAISKKRMPGLACSSSPDQTEAAYSDFIKGI